MKGSIGKIALCLFGIVAAKAVIIGAIVLAIWVAKKNHHDQVQDMWKVARKGGSSAVFPARSLANEKAEQSLGVMLFGSDAVIAVSRNKTSSSIDGRLSLLQNLIQTRQQPPPIPSCSTECRCTKAGFKAYGRYCGYGYSGCDNYGPCDAADACCMAIANNLNWQS